MEPDNLLLDRYILSLSDKPRPRVCFIGTASGDSERYIGNYLRAYRSLDCEANYLALFKPPTRDLRGYVFDHDIVHVGGGNTKNLLCLWREWGLDQILREAYQSGIVLSGMSAGMICWFEDCVTDSFGDSLDRIDGLGILKGSATPHFDGEAQRKPYYLKMLHEGRVRGGIALDDGVGALYLDEKLDSCVSSRPKAGAYLYEGTRETRLPVRFLG